MPDKNSELGLDREIYERVVNFWQKYVPIKLEISDNPKAAGDNAVPVIFVDDPLSSSSGDSAFATFHNDTASYNEKLNWYCHSGARVELYRPFAGLSKELKEECLAHEIGHVLGLSHRPETLMAATDWFGFTLNEDQIKTLRFYYGLLFNGKQP